MERAISPNQIAQRWYRRHIIVDHPARIIYIQVLWDGYGEFKVEEFTKINNGIFWDFIPKEMVQPIREGIASGYKVRPLGLVGGNVGEDTTVYQLLDVTEGNKYVKEPGITAPIAE